MTDLVKKYGKYIAIIIVISLLATLIPIFLNSLKLNQVRASDSDSEKKIAADISNMTGVKVEEIMKLRNSGRTWNEVLSKVKSTMYDKDNSDRRDNVLTEGVLGDDYVANLEKEGYSKEKILDIKMRAERLVYDLKELTSENDNNIVLPKVDTNMVEKDTEKDFIKTCSNLTEKLDLKVAVYLAVKLEKDFGSIDKVLDEYLLSLQLEINLEQYLIDSKSYEKEKAEKTSLFTKEVVTLAKIEDALLKKIQTDSKKTDDKTTTSSSTISTEINDKVKSPLPDIPVPDVKDMKPQDPINEIMKEIQTVDPMRNGGK